MNNQSMSFDLPPPGFRGLDPDRPVTIYRRHLPHWRQEGATYFVTFRLSDSLPRKRAEAMRAERERWRAAQPAPAEQERMEFERREFAKLDQWLDEGHGSCVLAERAARDALMQAMEHFNGLRYELGAYVVMPTHVHVIVKPLAVGRDSDPAHSAASPQALEGLLGSWKRHSARRIHAEMDKTGALWQDEKHDRLVRDTPELRRTVTYLDRNPAKAGVSAPFWVRHDWEEWFHRGQTGVSAPAKWDGIGIPSYGG